MAKVAPTRKPGTDIAPKDAPRDALGTVVTRNEFYRDGYRRLVQIARLEAVAILALIAVLALTVSAMKGRDRFFATTSDGRVLQMAPLDQPNLPTSKVLSWATEAAAETMTFNFSDYRKRLQDSSRFFTRNGWQTFNDALSKSNLLEAVQSLQQVVTAAPRAAPVILQEGLVNNVYQWQVQIPFNITYQAGSKEDNHAQLITLVIVRVSTLETPDGIAIDQWIAGDLR
jgi:intracellular multiplication protein IcmL